MVSYCIKSAFCLFILYGFYHLFLRTKKIFLFNRFFLILSLLLSLIIPLIVIPVRAELPFSLAINSIAAGPASLFQGKTMTENNLSPFTMRNVMMVIYFLVSSVLLIRFAVNIFRILKKIGKNKKINYHNLILVALDEKGLPYSFFRFIFVNRSDYESGRIENELLIHEEAHCIQYHSLDIIFIEVINILFWFNPVFLLFRKEILLNHEYYADNKVLIVRDPVDYQKLLLNVLLQNNSGYLVSNFKYSSIKKRLIMMTRSYPLHNAVLRKISAISLLLLIAVTLAFSQVSNKKNNIRYFENEWWYPILKKHHIQPHAFNGFSNVFEMGTTNSVDNKIVTLENAFFLIKSDSDSYTIIKSPLAYHDIEKKLIRGDKDVTIEVFKYKSKRIKPVIKSSSTGFTYYLK